MRQSKTFSALLTPASQALEGNSAKSRKARKVLDPTFCHLQLSDRQAKPIFPAIST